MLDAACGQAKLTFFEDVAADVPFEPLFVGASSSSPSSSKAEFPVSLSSKDVSISDIVTSISTFTLSFLAFVVFFTPFLAANEQSVHLFG
jgi:hypothetical protein